MLLINRHHVLGSLEYPSWVRTHYNLVLCIVSIEHLLIPPHPIHTNLLLPQQLNALRPLQPVSVLTSWFQLGRLNSLLLLLDHPHKPLEVAFHQLLLLIHRWLRRPAHPILRHYQLVRLSLQCTCVRVTLLLQVTVAHCCITTPLCECEVVIRVRSYMLFDLTIFFLLLKQPILIL